MKMTSESEGKNLSSKSIYSGLWVILLRFTTRGLEVGKRVILARLLAPDDFGLFGIAMLMLGALEAFTRTGFDKAVIHEKNLTEEYLNTAWLTHVIRGLILGSILFVGAPFIASFFNEPLAVNIIRVIALMEVFKGAKSIGVILFRKNLDFRKKFIYEALASIGGFAVAVILAFLLRSVWALVWGVIIRELLKFLISFYIHPFRPEMKFSINEFKSMVGYGKWALMSSTIVYIALHIDDLIVGRILGSASLGFFQMAFQMSNQPPKEISRVISRVGMPTFSKLQDNKTRLKRYFLIAFELVCVIAIPMVFGMIYFATYGIIFVLGEDWSPMINAFRILAIGGLARTIASMGAPAFYALGFPKGDFELNKWRFLTLTILIFPLTYVLGLEGAAIASTLAILTTLYPLYNLLYRHIKIRLNDVLKTLIIVLISSATMIAVLHLAKLIFYIENLFILFIYILVGIFIYFSLIILFYKIKKIGPWQSIIILASRLGLTIPKIFT